GRSCESFKYEQRQSKLRNEPRTEPICVAERSPLVRAAHSSAPRKSDRAATARARHENLRAHHDGNASLERSQEESRSAPVQLLCVPALRFDRGRPEARVPGGERAWICGQSRG